MIFAEMDFSWMLLAIAGGLLIGMFLSKRKKVDKTKIAILSKDEFYSTMRKGTLVDVRSEKEFEESKIVGARNYPKRKGIKDSSLRKDLPLFLYDNTSGNRIYEIAKTYVKKGAIMVYILKDGYKK